MLVGRGGLKPFCFPPLRCGIAVVRRWQPGLEQQLFQLNALHLIPFP